MPFGFTMPPASAVKPRIMRVAFTSNLTDDRREFEITADAEPVIIGRASRTRGKQLAAQPDNALFDCPVVSRLHAELHASTKPPFQHQVTITDSTSLHGTKVNGLPLTSGSPFALKTGDVIKLGERVTRGDGVSITFERLPTPPPTSYMSSTADLQSTNTIRGFRAPSFSDASDIDSDHAGSYISDGEHHPSSAKTTPEQNKMKLGSQKAPISLDDDDVTSVNEDVAFSYPVPESAAHLALNSSQHTDFDSFSDAGSLREVLSSENLFLVEDGLGGEESEEESDIDHVDDVEYGEELDEDNMSNMSDSVSDLSSDGASNEDDEQDEADEEDGEVEEPAQREPSAELGTFDAATEAVAATAFADMAGVYQSRWDQSSSTRYDPVRSSAAVVEQGPVLHHQAGRTTITPFTYGIPGYRACLATNFPTRSYWDVQFPVYGAPPSKQTTSAYEQDLFDYSHQTTNPQSMFPMSIDSIVEPPITPRVGVSADTMSENTAADTFGISKETIPEAATDSNSKRKRDEVDDAVDNSQPPAKKTTQIAPPLPPVRRRLSPKSPRSALRKAVVSATQAAAFAAAGAVGTVAFLSSPMAESLIQWLG